MESDRSIFFFLLCEFRAIAEGSLANCQALIIWLTNLICHLLFDCISFSEFHELIKYKQSIVLFKLPWIYGQCSCNSYCLSLWPVRGKFLMSLFSLNAFPLNLIYI